MPHRARASERARDFRFDPRRATRAASANGPAAGDRVAPGTCNPPAAWAQRPGLEARLSGVAEEPMAQRFAAPARGHVVAREERRTMRPHSLACGSESATATLPLLKCAVTASIRGPRRAAGPDPAEGMRSVVPTRLRRVAARAPRGVSLRRSKHAASEAPPFDGSGFHPCTKRETLPTPRSRIGGTERRCASADRRRLRPREKQPVLSFETRPQDRSKRDAVEVEHPTDMPRATRNEAHFHEVFGHFGAVVV